MAIFHLSVKTIGRSSGRSSTAAAAYRSGEKIRCERTGLVHDYTRKKGVEYTEIFTPDNSPEWSLDRSTLWNCAEQYEKRKNSTVAREFEVAIPNELDKEQRKELIKNFCAELVDRHSMAVDAAIHAPDRKGDERNYHAHILCSTRRLNSTGFTEKTRELDVKTSGEVEHWRERWKEVVNFHLEKCGYEERIDHRSLEKQRESALENGDNALAAELERLPTVHIGPKANQMEKRGVKTERGDINRGVERKNAEIVSLVDYRNKIDKVRSLFQLSEAEAVAKWDKEQKKYIDKVSDKAERIHSKSLTKLKAQTERISQHKSVKPSIPKGLFPKIKNIAYGKAIKSWGDTLNKLENRWNQLHQRVKFAAEYIESCYSMLSGGKGVLLAAKKAKIANPELSDIIGEMTERTSNAKVANMKEDIISEPKQIADAVKERANNEELKQLEKSGFQAELQRENMEEEAQAKSVSEKPEAEEDKQAAILEKFKQKISLDRESSNDIDRG